MTHIGWNKTNAYGETTSNYSKNHIVDEDNNDKTLCGQDIPMHSDHDGGSGYCKRCEKKHDKRNN